MSIWGKVTDWAHDVTGIPTADQKRRAAQAMNDQVAAYKQQSELSRQEIADKQNQEAVEKRRVEEKQIRALRGNYRPPSGLLGQGNTSQPDQSSKLGA